MAGSICTKLSTGNKAKGLADEALGNVKQTAGNAFDSYSLTQDGAEQERCGKAEQGKGSDRIY